MEELKKLLAQTDEEYLIGLSNKGTVKRAYKDLEQESPSVVWEGEEAEVALKEAVCRIRVPLGDSTCSCPSRSVCRHLITAVLYLKKELEKSALSCGEEAGTEAEQKAEAGAKAEKQSPGALLPELEQKLLSIPAGRLRQACKTRGYREFLLHMDQGELPKLEPGASGSLLTVRFPWNQMVVKLLSPLEHSTCSCHSRELCVHKAQAVLAFQLQKGTLTRKQLEDGRKEAGEWDLEELSQAAGAMKAGLSLQLLTGLSRLSPEAEESMERLAVISHGAGLPDFETVFRSAASEYRQYFQRSGAFRTESLLARLLGLYARAVALEQMKEPEKLRALAGTFRDTYAPVPRLHLTAIGGRSFQSKTGYAGERYYFLETEQKRWYTWTDVRPVFYEGIRRRPAGNYEQEQAPWGLNCSRADMMELEFYLDQAKAAEDGRLSVSRETKSEIAGQRNLSREEIREMVVWDYRELLPMLEGQERRFRKAEGRELLALAGAVPLVTKAALTGSALRTASLTAYGVSLVLLYTASAVYHGVRAPRVKRVLRIMDHCSIFVLILGTYIPMSLLVVGGRTGWLLFLTNTTLAVIGITLNAIDLKRFDKVSMALYALMGWLIVVALRAIIQALPPLGLALLVGGGLAYTVGILFYKSQRGYMHFVWHLFVLAGSVLQYVCIALYCV